MKLIKIILPGILLGGCSSVHRVNGWYSVSNFPENMIEGKAIVTTEDFAAVSLDTVTHPDYPTIVGKIREDKIGKWAQATEKRIGKRIGFVFNDSVIMAPTVNCRIESGSFTIESPDRGLIKRIYSELNNI